jgi:hypothetical protein
MSYLPHMLDSSTDRLACNLVHDRSTTLTWRRHLHRFSSQGLRRTFSYYVLTVGAEKLGIRFQEVLEYSNAPSPITAATAVAFDVVNSMSNWSASDLASLNVYGGDALRQEFTDAFRRGEKCAVARWGGVDLGCVCWLANTSQYFLAVGQSATLIQRCFTLPQHRGKALYPQTLAFAIEYLMATEQRSHRIFIECSKFNYASQKGIRQAGFVPVAQTISAFNRSWTRMMPTGMVK